MQMMIGLNSKRKGKKCGCIGAIIRVVMTCLTAVQSLGKVYTVGDSAGWVLGLDYAAWSSSKTFLIGDSLVFKYDSGHTVDEVSERDYKTCRVRNPINSDNKGTTTILLQTPGPHFFICGIIGHCGSGMKLSVNVLASGGPPASAANYSSSATSASPATAASGYGIFPTTATTMIPDSASPSSSGRLSLPPPPPQGGFFIIFFVALLYLY